MTCDHDVVRIGRGHASGDRTDTALRYELDPDRGPRIDALEIEDQLRQIFNGVDVMVWRRADERDPRLGMAQTGDQLGHLVAGKLATFARLRSLGDLDFNLLSMAEIFRGHAKARRRNLLHLVIANRRSPRIGWVGRRIFPAFPSIRTSANLVHGL